MVQNSRRRNLFRCRWLIGLARELPPCFATSCHENVKCGSRIPAISFLRREGLSINRRDFALIYTQRLATPRARRISSSIASAISHPNAGMPYIYIYLSHEGVSAVDGAWSNTGRSTMSWTGWRNALCDNVLLFLSSIYFFLVRGAFRDSVYRFTPRPIIRILWHVKTTRRRVAQRGVYV